MKKNKGIKEKVEEYISSRPILIHYLSKGLINISALTRKIKKELKIKKSDEAVMMAIYRTPKLISEQGREAEKIISKSEVGIKTGYAVVVSKYPLDIEFDAFSNFGKIYLYILPEKNLPESKRGIISIKKDLLLVEFTHPIEIEEVPGVVFHITSLFYEMNISIVELISSWDKTYVLIEEKEGERIIPYLISKKMKRKT